MIAGFERIARQFAVALLAGALLAGCGEAGNPGQRTAAAASPPPVDWARGLEQRLEEIDNEMPGRLGVHLRHADSTRLDRGADRDWYLASTIKIPVAIAVLEQVEAGELSLEQTLTVQESDFVDGAGDLHWRDPGFDIRLEELIEKSLRDSDSTATDMLIRLVGADHLNRRVAEWAGAGFNDITTIMQVRYDVYGPAHPGVAELSNMDILMLRNAEAGEPRLQALARALGVPRDELEGGDFDALFASYYEGGLNSARLEAFGTLLERFYRGELLNEAHTKLLLGHMQAITTGDRRIVAGLPGNAAFAQKTGTQIGRACNVGILNPESEDAALVVVACVEDFGAMRNAEQAFQALGRALGESLGLQ